MSKPTIPSLTVVPSTEPGEDPAYAGLIERSHQFVEALEEDDLTPARRLRLSAMLDEMKEMLAPTEVRAAAS